MYASLSYGKDSITMCDLLIKKNVPLDGIITSDVMFSENETAYLPEVNDFRYKIDRHYEKLGYTVKHLSSKTNFVKKFYSIYSKGNKCGQIYGFPSRLTPWCQSSLKINSLKNFESYIGYTIDEKKLERQKKVKLALESGDFIYPLVTYGYTEEMCYNYCKSNNLLNPSYEKSTRDGCWFCFNQSIDSLRTLYYKYPEYYNKLLQLEKISPYSFRKDYKLSELVQRFKLEEKFKKYNLPINNKRFFEELKIKLDS